MKKQLIFSAIILFATMAVSSCGNRYASRTVNLTNLTDSVNYALGLANGDGIRQFYLQGVENHDAAIKAFIRALDEAFNSDAEPNEMYDIGVQIGMSLRQMEKDGLMGEEELKSNTNLIKKGLEAGMKGNTEKWTPEEARVFIDMVLAKLQEDRIRAMFDIDFSEFLMDEDFSDFE